MSLLGPRKDVVAKSSAPKKVSTIQFCTLRDEDIQKTGELEVSSKDLFSLNGCMDPRLGVSDKATSCQTCNKKLADCAGHFGYINLALPVFHAGYFKNTLVILQCICKSCSAVLLPPQSKEGYLKKLRNPNLGSLAKTAVFKTIVEQCKKASRCPYCGYGNGKVKKAAGVFKLVHERSRAKDFDEGFGLRLADMGEILAVNPDLKPVLQKDQELLNPQRAYTLLKAITEEDTNLLWMDSLYSRVDTLIQCCIPVPPVPIRPSVPQAMSGGTTEDDITIKLREIVEINNELKRKLKRGDFIRDINQYWEELQIRAALLINGDSIPRLNGEKKVRGIYQRLKGKQGRLRGNLSGKRVDFSGRTVISPDPNLLIEQIGVPELVAKVMTYPERVNKHNIEQLRTYIMNGPEVHPGAIIVRSDTHHFLLQFADRKRVADFLKYGDVVERHMKDDDVVLFNRQPSLHKMSIMAHRVKVFPWRTFRFNECCCTPYNADFDGDEMNLHLPQTEEAKAEAAELMQVSKNLISPRNGEPLIAATQDFLTGAFFLTQKDVFLPKGDFCRLVAYLSDANIHIDMIPPAIWKPRMLWTGKQVITMLVRPNRTATCHVNLESEEKFYTKKDKHFCPQDGYVAFRSGELVCGNLGKKTLGAESKSGLFYVLIRDYGYLEATLCMSRLAKLCARFLGDRGFSIGISDVTPTKEMLRLKNDILFEGQSKAEELIDAYNTGSIRLKPGCNAIQSLESDVNGVLGKIREKIGNEALVALNIRNAPLCMAQCGSKGSTINISQMIACLGQQSVGGSRIQNGFVNRTLPHFPALSLSPAAKGFVANSFYSGLTATEFFFHTMGGREGLVDTAVKTAETGYMARRLMKALEDLSMQYDNTVRNSEKTIIQFAYGEDGLDPSLMEKGDRPVDYSRLMVNICSSEIDSNEDTLHSSALRELVQQEILSDRFQSLLPAGQQFLDETIKFFDTIADELVQLEKIEQHMLQSLTVAIKIEKSSITAGTGNSNIKSMPTALTLSKNKLEAIETLQSLRDRLSAMSAESKVWWRQQSQIGGAKEFYELHRLLRSNIIRLTKKQVYRILESALFKYSRSMISPGESVGAVGAQSIAEPSTQMTLKTFHFAGVASMNVTLGVPRLKEIINAAENISTPIIKALLVQPDSITSARIVKSQLEKTTLGEVCEYMREVTTADQTYISIKLDMKLIQKFHLTIDAYKVRHAILSTNIRSPALKALKDKHVLVTGSRGNRLHVLPPDSKDTEKGLRSGQRVYFTIQALKANLPLVIVKGIQTVSRAVINQEKEKAAYYILVEGLGLEQVMGSPGVDGRNTVTNNIIETQKVLGIEAARFTISSEIKYIMNEYGITVDRRHLMLLSDVMTFKGQVLGITRFGVAKMRESVLTNASFEQTMDHLLDAAVHSRQDALVGVSECIITGMPIPMGTGLFKVIHKPASNVRIYRRTRLLDIL